MAEAQLILDLVRITSHFGPLSLSLSGWHCLGHGLLVVMAETQGGQLKFGQTHLKLLLIISLAFCHSKAESCDQPKYQWGEEGTLVAQW